MKKLKRILLGLFGCILFVPKVYALSFDISMSTSNTLVSKGTAVEISVSIVNIENAVDGVSSCSMNISFDNNIVLNTKVRTVENWNMSVGNRYLFDTSSAIVNNGKMFVIPVKVNGAGSVILSNIKCADYNNEIGTSNKSIAFTIKSSEPSPSSSSSSINPKPSSSSSSGTNKPSSTNKDGKSSNCDLSNIILSEGTIEFDSNILEYEISIDNVDSLEITPVLEDDKASFVIDKSITSDGKNLIDINVVAEDGTVKQYKLYIIKSTTTVNNNPNESKFNFKIEYIFIGIIILLLFINIVRIINKNKKNAIK